MPGVHKLFPITGINKSISNDWGTMTNPRNKKTHQEFINEVPKELAIEITGIYINTDTKIEYKCDHGINYARPWQILRFRHCCRKGYYESGRMWESIRKTVDDWKKELKEIFHDEYVLGNLSIVPGGKISLECKKHGTFEQWAGSLKKGIGCKACVKEKEKLRKQQQAWENFIETGAYLTGRSNVSKSETRWLDKLGIEIRQKLLEDVGLTVDGYDEKTNTVYLYHGKFWHGCPETYDPEMQHPVVKIKMKDLYNQTMQYEQKIKDAGYNLITIWGT
jgi:hypothetical protein